MTRDWIGWHREYDDPASSLARRLVVVQQYIRRVLDAISEVSAQDEVRVISLCAGDGRDLLPVLGDCERGVDVRALLVERDARLAGQARRRARELNLSHVDVRTDDAGSTSAYADIAPAHLVLACGVFGNITADDGRGTVASLRTLTAPNGVVVWTRGRESTGDPSSDVRNWFGDAGFTERSFTTPAEPRFRVGMHQLDPASAQAYQPDVRMFTFIGG